MSLTKPDEPRIPRDDPWANDSFNRKREGEILIRLIQSLQNRSYVIGIKGKWGTGKSVFLQRITAALEIAAPKIPVIFVDAWRTDYLEDPLIAFVAATDERITADQSSGQRAAERAKHIVEGLFEHGTALASSAATSLAEMHQTGSGPAAGAAVEAAAAMIKRVRSQRRSEENFRSQLEKARDFLSGRERDRPLKPIVVAIDELDRCRPDYAIKTLDRIKHFFDVPGVIFLIATDGTNLPNAVASVYGVKVDGETYLRKFFDYEFELTEPDVEQYLPVLESQYGFDEIIAGSRFTREDLARKIRSPFENNYVELVSRFDRGLDALESIESFATVAARFGLTLRDQSQSFTLINAYLRSVRDDVVVYPSVLVFLACLRFKNNLAYEKLRSGEIQLSNIFQQGTPFSVPNVLNWIDKTPTGLELSYFSGASGDDTPEVYLRAALENTRNNSPYDHIRATAVERLVIRQKQDKGAMSKVIPRILRLSDAFG